MIKRFMFIFTLAAALMLAVFSLVFAEGELPDELQLGEMSDEIQVSELPDEYDVVQDSGTCGENISWERTNHYVKVEENSWDITKTTLVLTGTGEMPDYGYGESPFDSTTADEIVIG